MNIKRSVFLDENVYELRGIIAQNASYFLNKFLRNVNEPSLMPDTESIHGGEDINKFVRMLKNVSNGAFLLFCHALIKNGNFIYFSKILDHDFLELRSLEKLYKENEEQNEFKFKASNFEAQSGLETQIHLWGKLSICIIKASICTMMLSNNCSVPDILLNKLLKTHKLSICKMIDIDFIIDYFYNNSFIDDVSYREMKIINSLDEKYDCLLNYASKFMDNVENFYCHLCHSLLISGQFRLYSLLYEFTDVGRIEKFHKQYFQSHAIRTFNPLQGDYGEEIILDSNSKLNNGISTHTQWNSVHCGKIGENIQLPEGVLKDLKIDTIDACDASKLFSSIKFEIYRNFSNPRGTALIINNNRFHNEEPRTGTEVDKMNIAILLQKLNYRLEIADNLKAEQIIKCIKNSISRSENSAMDSFVLVILTHGEYEKVLGVDGEAVYLHSLINQLNAENSPLFAGKPKIVMIQACRGGQYDYGVSRNMSADDVDGATNSKPKSIPKFDSPTYIKSYPETILPISPRNSNSNAIPPRNSIISSSISQSCAKQRVIDPTNADILIAQATTPNFVAWRNRELGSWFIQSICEIFAQFAATEDIQGMLTRVNSRVAMRESDKDRAKQIPETTSTLRKKFYFFPGIERELF